MDHGRSEPHLNREDEAVEGNKAELIESKQGFWSLINEWRWEFFTWTLGTAAFASTLVLLVIFRNKPISAWKSKVQITAIIAALAQTVQSALLVSAASCISQLKWIWFQKSRRIYDMETFDGASRGPEGSLKLLFKMPKPRLVSLGAFTIILMLAFQTFVQQAVQLELHPVRHENAATIKRATSYQEQTSDWVLANVDSNIVNAWDESDGRVDYYLVSAVVAGMGAQNRTLSDVLSTCQTGRCTWDSYMSLGICTTIENITDTIFQTKTRNGDALFLVPDIPVPPDNSDFLMTTLSYKNYLGQNYSTPQANGTNLANLASIYALYDDPCDQTEASQGVFSKAIFKAYKATMRPCIQTLTSGFDSTMNTSVIVPENTVKWVQREKKDCMLRYSPSGNEIGPCNLQCATVDGSTEEYCIRDGVLQGIGWQIANVFNISAILDGHGSHAGEWGAILVDDILGAEENLCPRPAGLGEEGFQRRVENVAISMTNALREANSSLEVSGTAWIDVQFIHVDFRWLVLPVFVYISITVLLFCTVIKSWISAAPIWKQSFLGVLPRAASGEGVMSRAQLRDIAKHDDARLLRTGRTWKFN